MDINSFVIGFKKGKASGGGGGGSGGGVELNIAYGDTPPEDTTKLWVKTTEPSGVVVSPNVEYEVLEGDSVTTLTETMSRGNSEMGCVTVGSKVYLLFGTTGEGDTWKHIFCFDTETKTYTTLAAVCEYALAGGVCEGVGTKIYYLGGRWSNSTKVYTTGIYRLDTETDELTKLSAKVSKWTGPGGAIHGTDIYIFGGKYHATSSSSSASYWSKILRFNTETETITTLSATLPVAMFNMGCACVGSKIYLFGGESASSTSSNQISCFDIDTQKVTVLETTLPYVLRSVDATPLGDKIYLFGGLGSGGTDVKDTIICFDTKTESCEVLPVSVGEQRYHIGTTAVGEKIYLFGGHSGTTGNYQRDTIQYFAGRTEAPVVESGAIHIFPQVTENLFTFIDTDTVKAEIGVDSVLKGNADGHGEPVEAALYKDGAWTTI